MRYYKGWGRTALCLCAVLIVAGCSRREPRTDGAKRVGGLGGDLVAVDDTLRGVTCYTRFNHTLSCVKVK